MCIIVAKPTGIDIPLEETLNNCFNNNKDGIGFSYNLPGETPVISKGFMNVKKLMNMLKAFHITKEHNLIIHFRYATHGKKDQGNCHPFPISPDFNDMRLLFCKCPVSVAHNGVFSGMPQSTDHSDTMKFIGGILASPEIINNLDSKSIKELIRGYCGYSSKLAFLRTSGISLIGEFEKEEGVFYSNTQFRKTNHYSPRTDGTSWCGIHKEYDSCRYCHEHKGWDNCYKKEVSLFKEAIEYKNNNCCETTIKKRCLWCRAENDINWDREAEGYLCQECSLLMETK